MDIEKIFHTNGGIGHTSYARNSSLQKKAYDKVKHITTKTIQELYLSLTPKSLGIADLGCSSGPNTLSVIRDIIQAVQVSSRKILHQPQELRIYLNDLPTNDFNSIFKSLPDFIKQFNEETNDGFPSIFIGGYPGSFYGRLFPNCSIHFIFSSNSLHWLSRVPPTLFDEKGKSMNKGAIYISELSPLAVSQAYCKQFQEDFSLFLRSRSEEVVGGGRMVLILLGREGLDHVDRGNSFFWKLLSSSFDILVSKGEIEKEKVDSYDVHFYAPSKSEIEEEVRRESLFELDLLEMFEIERDDQKGKESYGSKVAGAVRAIQESMIKQHFGEAILDSLFDVYGRMVDHEMAKEEIKPISFVVVLRKL